MRNILVVTLTQGLCNRLRVLLCAIAYSEVTDRKLLLNWSKEEQFGAALSDLWEHPYQEIGIVRRKVFESLFGRYTKPDSIHLGINDPVLCLNTIYTFCRSQYPAPLASYLSRLKLIEPLEQQIESFTSQWFNKNAVVGVSMRYKNAHPKTLEASPPEWFIQRINELHEQFPGVLFSLSTDCEEASQLIRSSTQATICQLPRNYRSNQPDGIQEALCELYLLARTNYVLGSYWSSFSDMAGRIRGNSTYENSKSRPDEATIASALTAPILTPQLSL